MKNVKIHQKDTISRKKPVKKDILTNLSAMPCEKVFQNILLDKKIGRSERIRTFDLCVPNAALYQAEPHPVRKTLAAILNGEGLCGCPTRIRTQTNRVRVCRATFTQSGNSNMNNYSGSAAKVKTYREKTAFIFFFWRKVPLIGRHGRYTIHIANAKLRKRGINHV